MRRRQREKRPRKHPASHCPAPTIDAPPSLGDLFTCSCGKVLGFTEYGWVTADWYLDFVEGPGVWALYLCHSGWGGVELFRSEINDLDGQAHTEWAKLMLAKLGLEVTRYTRGRMAGRVYRINMDTQPSRLGARALARAELLNELPEAT